MVYFSLAIVDADHRVGVNVGTVLTLEAFVPFLVGFATE